MIEVTKAIDLVTAAAHPLGAERAALADSVGRVLVDDIVADMDMPPFDRSQMDGYAVIAADTANVPAKLKVVGESAAGHGWHQTLRTGETIAIMTGAPLPNGADAVQKIELTRNTTDTEAWKVSADDLSGAFIEILEQVNAGRNIVRRGSETCKGQMLFSAGEVVTPNMIAAMAAFGCAEVDVAGQPRVSILGTGSEIVEVTETPGPDQIRNSNSVMLNVMSRRFGAAATILPNSADDLANLKSRIGDAARTTDVLIVTGGVSVGKYDLTKPALAELGAEIFFEKVRLKPGKPAVFARLDKALIFGLPGNPVSAAVTFHLFVRPALLAMQNAAVAAPRKGFAILSADVRAAKERETYLPAALSTEIGGHLVAEPLRWQGSSDFIGFSRAEALIVIERGSFHRKGEIVRIEYL